MGDEEKVQPPVNPMDLLKGLDPKIMGLMTNLMGEYAQNMELAKKMHEDNMKWFAHLNARLDKIEGLIKGV